MNDEEIGVDIVVEEEEGMIDVTSDVIRGEKGPKGDKGDQRRTRTRRASRRKRRSI